MEPCVREHPICCRRHQCVSNTGLDILHGWRYALIPLLVCLTVSPGSIEGAPGVDVLVLAPLTGPEALRGRAQVAGVRLALRELGISGVDSEVGGGGGGGGGGGLLVSNHRLDIRIFYSDTKCDRDTAESAIIQHLRKTSRKLVVLGGSCVRGGQTQSVDLRQRSGVLGQLVPQISFERHFSEDQYDVSVRPSVVNTHRPLAEWLSNQGWRQVAVVYGRALSAHRGQNALRRHLGGHMINVSLTLEEGTLHVVQVLQESLLRVVVLYLERRPAMELLCHLVRETHTMRGRFVWVLLLEESRDMLEGGCPGADPRPDLHNVYVFNVRTAIPDSQAYWTFTTKIQEQHSWMLTDTYPDSAYAHDATMLTMGSLSKAPSRIYSTSQREFAAKLWEELFRTTPERVVTGYLDMDTRTLMRRADIRQYTYHDGKLVSVNTSDERLGGDDVKQRIELEGVPLAAFSVMCSLALIGSIYCLAIMTFNILKRTDKMIKMTSPNINLVITIGALLGYVSMVTLGIDSSLVSMTTMAKLLQVSTFLLAFGYSLVFGSLFAKAWRVFFIFKNLNANGKNTRDEHLLFGVVILLFIDMVILIPWATVDHISCSRVYLSTSFKVAPATDVVSQTDACGSQLQTLWVTLLYVVKGGVLATGFYFTFHTRHITLPTLKDSREIYMIIYTVVVLALLSLPVLLTERVGMTMKYVLGAMAIFVVATATLTLAFIPKIYLIWKRNEKNSPESIRFLFSESLRRTQRHLGSCTLCCCIAAEDEDKYAQEVLGSEIDTLKRTIKEKDATIRELTDRLYFGTEKKLHEYISSPRNRSLQMADIQANISRRSRSNSRRRSPAQYAVECRQVQTNVAESPESSHNSSGDKTYGGSSHIPGRGRGNARNYENDTYPYRSPAAVPVSLSVHGLATKRDGVSHLTTSNHQAIGDSDESLVTPGDQRMFSPSNIVNSRNQYTADLINSKQRTPSPNHDSAIDDNSPSSIGSEQENYPDVTPTRPVWPGGGDVGYCHGTVLDLDAIENEVRDTQTCATTPSTPRFKTSKVKEPVSSYYNRGVAVSRI